MVDQQQAIANQITVFYSYAQADERLRQQLETHLGLLWQQGIIATWHDRQIIAGTDWAQEIDTHLATARVILLLISPDFLASDYCYGVELRRALERDAAGEVRVIPILLRPVADWDKAPFARLAVLPTNRKPITKWRNRDEAWTDVAGGIRRAIEHLQATASSFHQSSLHSTEGERPESTGTAPSSHPRRVEEERARKPEERIGQADETSLSPVTRYELHQVLVQLRTRAGLTRSDLARLLKVSDKSIQHWEEGTSTPKPVNLQRLVNVYVERGVFTAGQEQQEVEALWAKAKWEAALDDAALVWRDNPRKSPIPIEPSVLSQIASVGRMTQHGTSIFPFNASLTDPQEFYGRNDMRRRVLDHIAHRMSISLVGPRRVGKTWFLQYIQLVAPQELGASFPVAYLDATLPGCQTIAGFTRAVLEGLGATQPPVQEHSLTLLHLERVVKQLRVQGRTLVLCIDEFEGLCTPSFDRDFFSGLRAIAQTGMVLLTASKEDLVNLVSAHVRTSPFFNMLIPLTLGPFTRKEAEAFAQAKSQAAGFTVQEQQSLLAYGQSDASSWPPVRLQLVGLLLLEEKKSSDHDGPEQYRPNDPSYWQQFAQRVEAIYRKVVP